MLRVGLASLVCLDATPGLQALRVVAVDLDFDIHVHCWN
jgi:hypothetical protein